MADQHLDDEEVRERVARLDVLLERLESFPGAERDVALEAVETLTEVYGTALARLVTMVGSGRATVADAAADELVGHLMVLHGLHPDPTETRIAAALTEIRSRLGDGSDVVLNGLGEGVAHIEVTVPGCPSTASATSASVADVVIAAAPELVDVESVTTRPETGPAMIPVDSLLQRTRP